MGGVVYLEMTNEGEPGRALTLKFFIAWIYWPCGSEQITHNTCPGPSYPV